MCPVTGKIAESQGIKKNGEVLSVSGEDKTYRIEGATSAKDVDFTTLPRLSDEGIPRTSRLSEAVHHPMRTFLRTQGLTVPLTLAAGIALVLHLPINYLFMVYLLASKTSVKPWQGITSDSIFQGWWPLLSLALPSCASVCLEWWWYEIVMFLCGLLENPEASIAAMGILIQTEGLLYVFPFAISSSLSTRISHALGANQPSRAQWSATIGLTMAFGFGLSVSVFTAILKQLLVES